MGKLKFPLWSTLAVVTIFLFFFSGYNPFELHQKQHIQTIHDKCNSIGGIAITEGNTLYCWETECFNETEALKFYCSGTNFMTMQTLNLVLYECNTEILELKPEFKRHCNILKVELTDELKQHFQGEK